MDLDENVINQTLETKIPTTEELDDFKNKMGEWIKMDEQITKLQIAIKERKILKNALAGYIKTFMFKFDYHDVSINNSKIKARQIESLIPLKITDIKQQMLEFKDLSGETLITKIFDTENRKKKITDSVKRVIPKINHLEL